jgi:hypothetical protein
MKKNIKCLFLLSFLIFNIGNSQAQFMDWAPIGAKWWYKANCFTENYCGYFTLESKRDTIINGISANIIETEIFGGEIWENASWFPDKLIMYSDSNKVYNFFENEFYVLYDFNLQAGDTLTIQDTTKYRGFFDSNSLFQVVVDSNVVKSLNGYSLRHLYTTPVELSEYYFSTIIEKLGSLHNLFGESIYMPLAGYPGYFRCYQDEEIDITSEYCEFVSSVNNLENQLEVSCYPNPANELLMVKFEGNQQNEVAYSLHSIDGRILEFNKIGSSNSFKINLQALNAGVYFLKIYSGKNQENITSKVFIKH